jgi:hypothetical protein
MEIKENNIVFLLGAGCSKEAGIPISNEMVEKVEEKIKREWKGYNDLYYYLKSSIQYSEGIFGRFDNSFNIEKLLIVMGHIEQRDENIIYPFIGSWNIRLPEVAGKDFERITKLKKLINNELYEWVTPKDIVSKAEYYSGFKSFAEGVGKTIKVFSLNYDQCFEKIVGDDNVEQGFDVKTNEWQQSNFDTERQLLFKLYKLHGSINWYIFREEIDTVTIDRYGIPTIKDIHHCKNESGKNIFLLDAIPLILTGSYNKLYSYNFGIFHKIHNEFEDCLWKHKRIIMSGYGWNDKGINHRILEWLSSSLANKLILLHRNPDEDIKLKSISPMWHRYDDLVAEGRLIPIKKWLSEITFNEIKDYVTE